MPFISRGGGRRLHYNVVDVRAPWSAAHAPIILHHGIGAESGIWADWILRLGGDYPMVTFDMCGFGRSDVPDSTFSWSMKSLADDLLAVADEAGAKTFHFIGESIGGTVGLFCATNQSARFESLVISNGSYMGASVENVAKWDGQIDRSGVGGWSTQFMHDRFFPEALSRQKWDWFHKQQAAGSKQAILGALSALIETNLQSKLSAITQPTLLLHGDSSPFIPVDVMADLHKMIPGSELQIFSHARHGLPFSHATECAAVVHDFLQRRTRAGQIAQT